MSVFSDAAAALFADVNFGLTATLTPISGAAPQETVAVLSHQAVVVGEFGQVVEMRDTLSFLLGGTVPVKGDTVTIGSATYRLDALSADDGLVRTLYALRLAAPVYRLVTADGDALVTADGDYLMAA